MIIKKIIERTAQFETIKFYNDGIYALEDFKDPDVVLPELILLDINMPQMDGWQFLESLIELRPNFENETIIYVVTSSIAHCDREKANSFDEISGFLSKPVSVDCLEKIIKEHRKKLV
jgi:CheY-like chemotaxis protein